MDRTTTDDDALTHDYELFPQTKSIYFNMKEQILKKYHPKNRKNRKSKLKYSVPLLSSLCLIILIWHQFQQYFIFPQSESILSNQRQLLEEENNGDFPDDPFTRKEKQQGYIALHCLLMLYMFLGLAKICDDYFEPTLEVLCEKLDIKDDVAGATWMAAGGSAPELFTSIIGVFFAKSDIGFGTIVGSAVFNVLAVISVCAYFVPNLPVTGWPLARDSVYYCFGILIIISCVEDQRVYWYEALILLVFYVVYVYIMKFNEKLEAIVMSQLSSTSQSYNKLQIIMQRIMEHAFTQTFIFIVIIINVTFVIFLLFTDGSNVGWAETINFYISLLFVIEMILKLYAYGPITYWIDVWNAIDGVLVVLIVVEYILAQSTGSGAVRALRLLRLGRTARSFRIFKLMEQLGKVHIATAIQTFDMAIAPIQINDKNKLLGDDGSDNEIRKIEILSSTNNKLRPSLPSVNETSSDQQLIDRSNEKEEKRDYQDPEHRKDDTQSPIANKGSPRAVAKKQFRYNDVICVRNIARDGRRIIFFERNPSASQRPSLNNEQPDPISISSTINTQTGAGPIMEAQKPPRCIRLIINPDGSRKFEEYYSVHGRRMSRSFTGNFNLKIVPVAQEAPDNFNREWRNSADFSSQELDEESADEEPIQLWDFPSDGNLLEQVIYLVMYPMHLFMYYTIVDTQKDGNDRFWWLSFIMCIFWIAGLSYIMVWMASEIGLTANIPEPVMGITILAAGTSIPDMLSSLAVAKKGRGDMAVSSSIGSNIFDILFGLPFPWLIQTGLVVPGSYVSIESDGMTIMVLSLFIMVAFVILSIQQFAWKLSRKLAYVFAVLYCLFVVEAMLIEYGYLFS